MALIKCPECGREIENANESCPECGCPITVQRSVQNKKSSFIAGLRQIKSILVGLAVVCFIVSGVFFFKGYNVKNEYYNSEYMSLNENAYVGGDAYNYIINGTYFTGYSVIASAALISGVILVSNSVIITMKLKEYEEDNKRWL